MKIDWKRILIIIVAVVISAVFGYLGQPLIHNNKEAFGVIVNVFSILAGFLIAIMTLLGEPGLFRGSTWRSDAVKRRNFYNGLTRHKWLFIGYLLILGFVFITTLYAKTYPDHKAVIVLEMVILGSSIFAFIMSLTLPDRLLKLQMRKFDEQVENKKSGGL